MRKLSREDEDVRTGDVHGGRPYRIGGKAVLDFSSNVNPLGPPAAVLRALRRHLGAIAHYPDPWCYPLRERLAALHGIDERHIVVGNGTTELIHAVARYFPIRRAAMVAPTYGEYLKACLDSHIRREHWLAEGPHFDLEPFDPGRASLIWLCNPNNPTGRLWPQDRLVPWIESFPKKTFIVDESYLPFRDDEAKHSLVRATERLRNVIVLRSLTKFYSLPGLRLGYLVADRSKFFTLGFDLPVWSVNSLAQIAGIVALKDQTFTQQTRDWLRDERDLFLRQLRSFPFSLEPIPSEANFVLIRLRGIRSKLLARRLSASGIAIREAGSFIGLRKAEQYVRVAIRTREDNQQLVEALKTILVSGG